MPEAVIVVVDDNVELAENLVEILTHTGRRAVAADSAEAACELVRASSCAAVLTDLRLPGKSGTDLIGELRRRGLLVPVAVMTAHADAASLEEAEHAGAVDVLSKPLDIARVLTLLDALEGGSCRAAVGAGPGTSGEPAAVESGGSSRRTFRA